MHEIVDEVLKAEAEAEKIVTKAKEKADVRKNELEIELNQRIRKAKEDAQQVVHETIAAAKEKAEVLFKEVVAQAEAENREFLHNNSEKVDMIVDRIVKLIITPEYKRE